MATRYLRHHDRDGVAQLPRPDPRYGLPFCYQAEPEVSSGAFGAHYVCTRRKGHTGEHVAHVHRGQTILAEWIEGGEVLWVECEEKAT